MMKYFNKYLFFGLFCVLHTFDSVYCTDSVYEHISHYYSENSEYVDPDSLYYNRQTQSHYKSHRGADSREIAVKSASHFHSCKDNSYEVFARRLINILISKANLKINDGIVIGQLDIEATIDELEVLKGFGEGKISIRQVDGIINNVIRPPSISLFDEAVNFTDKISIYLYQHRIIFGAMLLSLFVILIALKVRWTRWRIIFLLFDIMFIISFMLTWWELLQEAEIKLAAQRSLYYRMPDECKQGQIGFFKSVWLFFGFGKGDCLKYFEAVMTDPVLKVTPLHAFSHMSTKFFFHPLSLAGHYISDFIEGVTSNVPFPFNHIARLLLVIFMPSLIGGLLFVSIGGSMGLRFGPFFHIYLHGRQSTPPANSLAYNDRRAIEVIREDILEVAPNNSINSARVNPPVQIQIRANTSTQTTTSRLIEAKPIENQDVFEKTKKLSQTKEEPKKQETEKKEEMDKKEQKKLEVEKKEDSSSDTSLSNSDDFPEEKEYEKISRKKLENEINRSTDKVYDLQNLKVENDKNENKSPLKSKNFLEI